jgi:hypothetical protein
MPSRYEQFDRSKLTLLDLSCRTHDVTVDDVLEVGQAPSPFQHPDLPSLADAIAAAVKSARPVLMLMGAHVIKTGLSRYVCHWLRHKWLSGLAVNGACSIHDYELARVGATSESVARYIAQGQFGLWRQTGEINEIVSAGDADGLGYGEAVGKAIIDRSLPHQDVSIFAAGYEAGVPLTVHVGMGYDIIHEHPNFDPAAVGRASYRDFLIFTRLVQDLQDGVVLCVGSAVMGPEIYLKALSMARNVAARQGTEIRRFTSAVFDLVNLTRDLHAEAPKDSPEYYYRPYKTVLVRTVRDGGRSYYIRGEHRATLPALHELLARRLG